MLKIFESRNKKISNLIQLGDYLGHSIRENVQLFSIDGVEDKVTYLTENKKIISGNYLIKNNSYILENINVQDSEIFTDDERFDDGVKNQVSLFLESLYHDDYTEADSTFTDVVDILTSRTHYHSISEKLDKKAQIFDLTQNILESDEFTRFVEVIPELVTFLAENKKQISSQVPEILNSLKLSEAVSNAFNIPLVTMDELESSGRFEFTDNSKKSIYEMICKQELVKKELLEAKSSFDLVWANEPVIDELASKIFSTESEVETSLTEAIKELPYLSLLSKKKLFETLSRNLGHSTDHISEKELRSYSSKLFEMKKPARQQLTRLLSEKYGVNLQYLKESYSFKSLINTQVVLFEAISSIAPKTSVLKQVLSELSTSLKSKNGIQGLDMNNIIQQVFQHANYSQEELPLMESFSFDEVTKAFEKAEKLVQSMVTEDHSEGDEGRVAVLPQEDEEPAKEKEGEEPEEGAEPEEETDGEEEQADSGEVQEKEVEDSASGKQFKLPKMSDEEIMKSIKGLSDIVNGADIEDEEGN
jgi:hypothetical protein